MTRTVKGLVFSPREPGFIPWSLLGFILLSACVHAFGFFLFQTIYPAASRMSPPPPQVSLVAPGTPESDAILRWINSEDPALAAEPTRAPIPGTYSTDGVLNDLPYIPSYQTPHARPTMLPPEEPALAWPDGVSGLDLMKLAAPHTAAAPVAVQTAATELNFSSPLEPAGPLPALGTLRESTEASPLQPARYLLGISHEGEVRYVFIQESSGDKSLDSDAASVLQQVKFRAGAEPLTWGFATFYWGSAVFAASSAASESPP